MSRQLAMQLADARPQKGETVSWTVIAELPRHDHAGAPPTFVGASGEGEAERFALLRRVGNDWQLAGPIVTFDLFYRTAEHIAGGDPRAITWPNALQVLATGACVMMALAVTPKDAPNDLPSPATPGEAGGPPSTPSPAAGEGRSTPADDAGRMPDHVRGQAGHAANPSPCGCGE